MAGYILAFFLPAIAFVWFDVPRIWGVATAIAGAWAIFQLIDFVSYLRTSFEIMPYFKKSAADLGEAFPLRTNTLLKHSVHLDEYLCSQSVRPLSSFNSGDDMNWEPVTWHQAADALVSINAVLVAMSDGRLPIDGGDELRGDLERLAAKLQLAKDANVPFCLLLFDRIGRSCMEFPAREGTF